MKRRPGVPAPKSSPTPVIVVVVSLALIGGLAWYFTNNQEATVVKSVSEKAEPPAMPAIESDPEMKTGARRVRTSDWKFEESESSKKLIGRITFDADDKDEALNGGAFGDVKVTLFGPAGEKLKVDHLRFREIKSGESSPTEITYGNWKKVKRVWLERTLREPAKEK